MASVRLDARQEAALNKLADETGRTKSYYIKEALDRYLEDRADYILALAVLEKNEPRYSAEQVRRELGL